MHYEIIASIHSIPNQLNVTQRTSPFFTDCPVIGAHSLRDRNPLKLDEKGWQRHQKDLRRLFEAHAIEIFEVDDSTKPPKKINIRKMLAESKRDRMPEPTPEEPKTEVSAPEETKNVPTEIPATVISAPTEPETEVQPEPTPATVEPAAPVAEPVAESHKKGKKGRKE
jgi:hypothetical protein